MTAAPHNAPHPNRPLRAGREWFEVRPTMGRQPQPSRGLIPRDVVEGMGIDCSVIDQGGTIWFTAEQSAAFRRHPEWEASL